MTSGHQEKKVGHMENKNLYLYVCIVETNEIVAIILGHDYHVMTTEYHERYAGPRYNYSLCQDGLKYSGCIRFHDVRTPDQPVSIHDRRKPT